MKIKRISDFVLLAGFAIIMGCTVEVSGTDKRTSLRESPRDSEKEDENLPVIIIEEEEEYTVLRLGPGGFFNAYHEGWVYATGDKGPAYAGNYFIYRMCPDGTKKQEIKDGYGLGQSVYHDGWLYYADYISMTLYDYDYDKFIEGAYGGALYRMRPDGSKKTQYTGVYGVLSYIIEGEWIYFLSGHDVYRVKINGGGLEKIADNCSRLFIIAEGYIFLRYGGTTGGAAQYDTKIIRCNLDGTGKTVLIEDEMIIFNPVFADGGYLYYTLSFGDYYVANFNGHDADWETSRKGMALHRMKIDGTERQTVVPHSSEYGLLQNIVLKDGYIYYSRLGRITNNNDDTSYYKVRLDGTDHVLLCDKITNYNDGFEIIGSHVYYHTSPEDIAGLYRLSINGGSPEAVYTYAKYSEYYIGYFAANNKFYIVMR